METLRSLENYERYRKYRAGLTPESPCGICEKNTLKDFKNWRIVPNDYPYDLIAQTHHMLVPKQHTKETGLTAEDLAQFAEIREKLLPDYDVILEVTSKDKSIPDHCHWHLLTLNKKALKLLNKYESSII